jgi:hypothetical protein
MLTDLSKLGGFKRASLEPKKDGARREGAGNLESTTTKLQISSSSENAHRNQQIRSKYNKIE